VEEVAAPAGGDHLVWRDLRPVLDDAIRGLPAKYRLPVVLCYLEGLTNAEAARRLGCPPGTVATRLSRARAQLRARLTRRGVVLPGGLLAAVLAREAAAASLPPALLGCTVGAALVAEQAGALPERVAALTEGVWRSLFMDRMKLIMAALVAVGLAGGAGVLRYRALAGQPAAPQYPAPTAAPAPEAAPPPEAPADREPQAGSSASYRTTNFIVTAPSRRCAQLVAEAGEHQRRRQAQRWLGEELPDWPEPCRVQVVLPSPSSPFPADAVVGDSSTTFQFDQGKVTVGQMHLHGPLDRILARNLPHEVTHAVFASAFRAPISRWADEGGAMLGEDEEDQQRYDELLGKLLDTPDRFIPMRRLLRMKDYPEAKAPPVLGSAPLLSRLFQAPDSANELAVFYLQSFALTRFLVERKDRKTFVAYVRQGLAGGWDDALQDQYGFRDLAQLERDWLADVRRRTGKDKGAEDPQMLVEQIGKQGPLALGVAQAAVDNVGRLVVRQQHYARRKNTTVGPNPVVVYKDVSYEQVHRFPIADVSAVRFGGAGPEPVKAGDLAELLREETTVLVDDAGQSLDPLLAKVIRKGTLILTLPPPPQEPPGPTPPPQPAEEGKQGNSGVRFSLPGQSAPVTLDFGFPIEHVGGTISGATFDPSR
jgi:hypothetical protein